jgi:hypothetical protein
MLSMKRPKLAKGNKKKPWKAQERVDRAVAKGNHEIEEKNAKLQKRNAE